MDSKAVLTIFLGRKPKVSYLEVIAAVEKDVLRFEVPMDYAWDVVNVLNRTKKLLEVVTREELAEATFGVLNLDKGKEVSLLY